MTKKRKSEPVTESTHAKLGPSTFKAREICPSYVPDEESTKAAERGTMLHNILEEHGAKAVKAKAARKLEEIDEVQLEMICNYTRPYEAGRVFDKDLAVTEIIREHRLNLKPLKITDCDKGTADLLILDRGRAHIDLMDYKLGWIEVDDAEVNIQTGIYAVGALFEFPWAQTVTVHILQPARDEVSTALISREEIQSWLLRAKTIAARVIAEAGKTFNPLVDNCLWCDYKGSCLALHRMVLKAAEGAQLAVPDGLLTPEDFNDPDQSGVLYDFAEILIKYAQAIKWKIITMSEEGIQIPGHELRVTNGKRVVVDATGALEILVNKFGVDQQDYIAALNPSISALEKLVSAAADYGSKGERVKEMSSELMGEGMLALGNPSKFLVRIKTKAE